MTTEARRISWFLVILALSLATGCSHREPAGASTPCHTLFDKLERIAELRSGSSDYGIDYDPCESDFEIVREDEAPQVEQAIVQLIIAPKPDPNGKICLDTSGKIEDIISSGKHLCDDVWGGTHKGRRFILPWSCSGLLLDEDSILTAAHCADIWHNHRKNLYVVRGRTSEPADQMDLSEAATVKCIEKYECQTPACVGSASGGTDLMVLRLNQKFDDVRPLDIAQNVTAGQTVRALFHPLGMRMMKSRWQTIDRCDDDGMNCYVKIDNAWGGSGGILLNEKNEVAGIIGGHLKDEIDQERNCLDFKHDDDGQRFSLAKHVNRIEPHTKNISSHTVLHPCPTH